MRLDTTFPRSQVTPSVQQVIMNLILNGAGHELTPPLSAGCTPRLATARNQTTVRARPMVPIRHLRSCSSRSYDKPHGIGRLRCADIVQRIAAPVGGKQFGRGGLARCLLPLSASA